MASQPSVAALEQFLYREARLLDEKRWEEWGALFTEDGEYWVPATRGQPDAENHVSLIYETALLRNVRLKRYRHPNAMSLQPVPHSVHLVSNVMLDSFDEASGTCVVNSRFIMLEYRRNDQRTYGGATTHVLEPAGQDFRIRKKKVELVNCDAVLPSIHIYF
ncbi:MAG TPA: aromatic-ring-hydroxylating dioxygenase subunit beta [Woeseiaceae bacterium]|nr:aromatic-ring-hydroxylating dioxygenase subunit beta [Woeseiaceae bacterium]